jgi:hypothetical protein
MNQYPLVGSEIEQNQINASKLDNEEYETEVGLIPVPPQDLEESALYYGRKKKFGMFSRDIGVSEMNLIIMILS